MGRQPGTQPRGVRVQGPARIGRNRVVPQQLNEPFGGYQTPGFEQQQSEKPSFLPPSQVDAHPVCKSL